jgi:hypothetical protein
MQLVYSLQSCYDRGCFSVAKHGMSKASLTTCAHRADQSDRAPHSANVNYLTLTNLLRMSVHGSPLWPRPTSARQRRGFLAYAVAPDHASRCFKCEYQGLRNFCSRWIPQLFQLPLLVKHVSPMWGACVPRAAAGAQPHHVHRQCSKIVQQVLLTRLCHTLKFCSTTGCLAWQLIISCIVCQTSYGIMPYAGTGHQRKPKIIFTPSWTQRSRHSMPYVDNPWPTKHMRPHYMQPATLSVHERTKNQPHIAHVAYHDEHTLRTKS